MSGAAARLRRHGPELLLLAAFALTRLVARMAFGLRFDGDVRHYWHVLDYPLLQDDLLRSILYLHDQPPLYNLGLGIVLKWVPASFASPVFEAAFLVLGYLGIVGIYALLVELGTPRGAALGAALVQTLSTTWLVYESWLFYTLPTAALMTWAAVWLARAARGSAAAATAFAAAVAGLSWIRATYQPVWVAAALALLLVAVRGSASDVRVSARRAALAALLLAMALPAKNWLLVGSFASSTWLGMNLAHMTTERLDAATREQWIAAGELHPVARVRAFAPLADYPEELRAPLASAPAHPALTAPLKSEGSPNLNHSAYVGIARAYLGASLVVVRKRPDVYLERVGGRSSPGCGRRPTTSRSSRCARRSPAGTGCTRGCCSGRASSGGGPARRSSCCRRSCSSWPRFCFARPPSGDGSGSCSPSRCWRSAGMPAWGTSSTSRRTIAFAWRSKA